MADEKITQLTENTTPALTDLLEIVDDPGGTPTNQKVTLKSLRRQLFPYGVAGGRLTLTTAVPVTTEDVTAAATLYYTPYKSGQIGLYDGSAGWDVLDFTELSLDISGYTASKPYDIWAYNNSGTAALDSTIWTNTTTRATALAYQNGILVKNGTTTRRYLGTIFVNSSGGQTDDSVTKRFVWNYYNRMGRNMFIRNTSAHNYTTQTVRSWNNDANIRTQFIIGVAEDLNTVSIWADLETCYVMVGYDVTDAFPTGALESSTQVLNNNAGVIEAGSTGYHIPAVGYHYYQATEYGLANATQNVVAISAIMMG